MKKVRPTPEEKIDAIMAKKLDRLQEKYPQFCLSYLIELHKAVDWAEKKLKKLIRP